MAKATVTIRLTPHELQQVDQALAYYIASTKAVMHDTPCKRPGSLDGRPDNTVRICTKIRQDIGLK